MAIRADSFSDKTSVLAYTRYLLDGEVTFSGLTRPTETEIEKFIDQASAHLNVALKGAGLDYSTVYSNSTAKLICDDWVTMKAVAYVELTHRGAGFNEAENSRYIAFGNMQKEAMEFVSNALRGLKFMSVTVDHPTHEGFTFTGLDDYDQRSDPDNTTRRQPFFRRGLFDNTT